LRAETDEVESSFFDYDDAWQIKHELESRSDEEAEWWEPLAVPNREEAGEAGSSPFQLSLPSTSTIFTKSPSKNPPRTCKQSQYADVSALFPEGRITRQKRKRDDIELVAPEKPLVEKKAKK